MGADRTNATMWRPRARRWTAWIAIAVCAGWLQTGLAAGAPAKEKTTVQGPLLTDKELFEALDLAAPGLEATRRAVGAGDLAGAKRALAAYLRGRKSVAWSFDPHQVDRNTRHNQGAADRTLEGRIQVVTVWHTFPGGDVDWYFNATRAREDLPDNNEWQWQLNRMGFWGELGRTYWATGDEKYAQAFVKHLQSWARQCVRPTEGVDNTAGSAWRTIECGIRMGGPWPDAYHRFLHSPSFTDGDVALYLKACVEHGRYLFVSPGGGNWLTMQMSGLYTVGCVLPELKEAAAWREKAAQTLYVEANKQFSPDGSQVELTPGYHNVALGNILKIPSLARQMGRTAELPPDFVARLEKAHDYNLFLMTPDRDLPRFNDSWPVGVPRVLEPAVSLFPERADFAWVSTGGKAGKPPASTSHPLPYAGYYVMRSGWEPDANYLCLDAGPLGAGHVHQDKLNVVLWAYGREVLFDGGGGSYERSRYRSFGTDTFSHNTVLVDGKPQRRSTKDRASAVSSAPVDGRWESTPAYDFAAGDYREGYGDPDNRAAVHTRRVLFVKPDLFVVADTLAPADGAAHTYQARWHLLPTAVALDLATRASVTMAKEQPNLAVVPLLRDGLEIRSASAQMEPELLGWHVRKDMDPQYVPATTVLHTRQGAGVQHFLTLLVPLRPGAGIPVKEVRPTALTAAEVVLTDGRRLTITADGDPTGGIRVRETLADGKPGRNVEGGGANG